MSKKTLHTGIAITVTVGIVGLFFILGLPFSTDSFSAFGGNNDQAATAAAAAADSTQAITQDVKAGSGAVAKPGDTLVVSYTGKLEDGTTFDTSVGKPAAPSCPAGTKEGFCFTLGAGEVIQGWDQALVGVQAGTRRLVLVPPALGYGSQDFGPIPANSALLFDITVLKVIPAGQ